MYQPRKAKARGAPAPHGRRRSRSVVLLLVTALVASVGILAGSPAPAGAAIVNTQAALTLTCTATPPVVAPLTVTQELTVDIEHPDAIPRNTVETVRISQPPLTVPTDLDGNTVINLNSIQAQFKLSSQFRVDSFTTVGGDVPASVNVTPTGDITFSVPGPLLGGQTYQLPEIVLDVRAVGTVGTSGTVSFSTFSLIARAQLPIIGANNVPVNCPTPSPNPPLLSIGIAPGVFSADPDPVTTSANINQQTKVRYGSTTVPSGATDLTSNPFSLSMTSFPDIAPGATTNVSIGVSPRDWLSPYNVSPHDTYTGSGFGNQRNVGRVWNWQMRLNGPNPSVFEVVSVSSADPAAMTATYDAGSNTIILARATGAAGELGENQTFSPPTVTMQVRAVGTGPYPQSSSVTFQRMSFALRHGTSFCFIICGTPPNPGTTANPTTTAAANIGGNPVGTQPNDTVFFRPITSAPVIGSLGIVVPPGTTDDTATVANNDVDGVDIDVLANDTAGTVGIDEGTVLIIDEPQFGTASVDPATGVVTYIPEFGTLEPEDGFTYVVQDDEGRYSNVSSVVVDIVGLFCFGPCSLTQTIIVDVDPDTLTMEQVGGQVQLDTVVLDGEPQTTTAAMQEIRVINERGGTAPWDITGQLTSDFKTDLTGPDCPASQPSTWYWLCVPGDNLGWEPLATVAHQQVPGDVAVAEAGATIDSGLRSAAQKLCGAPATESGGTFDCGALVSLGVPASAGAGTYSATLTLTLA